MIEIDRKWLGVAIPILKAFHDDYLIEREDGYERHLLPPTPTIHRKRLAEEYSDAKDCIELAKIRLDNAKAELISEAEKHGDKCIISGLNVTQIERKGSVSYAKVIKDLGITKDVLDKYTGKPTKYWSVK